MLRLQSNVSRRGAAGHPRAGVRAHAVEGMYNHIVPNMDYVNQVIEAFPDDAVANPDEARVRTSAVLLQGDSISAGNSYCRVRKR